MIDNGGQRADNKVFGGFYGLNAIELIGACGCAMPDGGSNLRCMGRNGF